MTTQVIFKIDKKLKDQAMKRAQKEGIAFSSVLKLATKAFVAGRFNVGLIATPPFNRKTRQELEESAEDIKNGKNISPMFHSAKEVAEYLMN